MHASESIVWEDFEFDDENEYQATRKTQDEEWERALKEEKDKDDKKRTRSENLPKSAKDEFDIDTNKQGKKSKILECPHLLPCDDNNGLRLRFRGYTGKMLPFKFHRDELISNVIQQLQCELKITSPIQLVEMRTKLETHRTLLESNIKDRSVLSIEYT